jgi:hypothetical protein
MSIPVSKEYIRINRSFTKRMMQIDEVSESVMKSSLDSNIYKLEVGMTAKQIRRMYSTGAKSLGGVDIALFDIYGLKGIRYNLTVQSGKILTAYFERY